MVGTTYIACHFSKIHTFSLVVALLKPLGCEASNGYERTLDLSVGDVSAGGNRVSPLLGNALTI